MAENRSREEIIEELIPLFESGTYPEITPLAREFLGDANGLSFRMSRATRRISR